MLLAWSDSAFQDLRVMHPGYDGPMTGAEDIEAPLIHQHDASCVGF